MLRSIFAAVLILAVAAIFPISAADVSGPNPPLQCFKTQTECKGGCVNAMWDSNHCGFCDNRCKGETAFCVKGLCSGVAPIRHVPQLTEEQVMAKSKPFWSRFAELFTVERR